MTYQININLRMPVASVLAGAVKLQELSPVLDGIDATVEYVSIGLADTPLIGTPQAPAEPAPAPEAEKPAGKPRAARKPADTQPGSADPATPPAEAAAPSPAAQKPVPKTEPAAATDSEELRKQLESELRAVLTPAAAAGRRAEVGDFVKGHGYATVMAIPADKLPAIIAEAKKKFA